MPMFGILSTIPPLKGVLLIPVLEQRKSKMSLEYLSMLQNKEIIKNDEDMSNGYKGLMSPNL